MDLLSDGYSRGILASEAATVTEELFEVTKVVQVLVVKVVVIVVLVLLMGYWGVCSCATMRLRANKKDLIFLLSFIHRN